MTLLIYRYTTSYLSHAILSKGGSTLSLVHPYSVYRGSKPLNCHPPSPLSAPYQYCSATSLHCRLHCRPEVPQKYFRAISLQRRSPLSALHQYCSATSLQRRSELPFPLPAQRSTEVLQRHESTVPLPAQRSTEVL